MKRHKLFLAVAFIVASATFSTFGVTALRTVRTVIQPDGTTLRIKKIGDERRHFTLTEDGIVLHEQAGVFTYACPGVNGAVESTGVIARDSGLRSSNDAIRLTRVEEWPTEERPAGVKSRSVEQSGMGMADNTFPVKGDVKAIVLLVEYTDVKFRLDDPAKYFGEMLNKPEFDQYGGTGSAYDYFNENSSGQFQPRFDVYGPIKLKNARSYYGANSLFTDEDVRPEEMVIEACDQLNDSVDFRDYDTNGDGLIDNIFVFYAGQGEATYGPAESVWPHSWDVRETGRILTYDGVTLATYGCTNEWDFNRPDGVGTFIHEFSHVMGLPDLYDTDGLLTCTPGTWSVLDYGPYNNNGCTPPNYGAYERNALGWGEPTVLTDGMTMTLQPITTNQFALIPTESPTEFFLLENRQKIGWDKYLPGNGMLVWHIDYSRPSVFRNNTVNNNRNHQYVDIIEAGGTANSNSRVVESRYPFPGPNGVTELTPTSSPALKDWAGRAINLPLTDIKENGQIVTFNVGDFNAVTDITADDPDPDSRFYNLQGIQVTDPTPGSLLIRVSPSTSRLIRF